MKMSFLLEISFLCEVFLAVGGCKACSDVVTKPWHSLVCEAAARDLQHTLLVSRMRLRGGKRPSSARSMHMGGNATSDSGRRLGQELLYERKLHEAARAKVKFAVMCSKLKSLRRAREYG